MLQDTVIPRDPCTVLEDLMGENTCWDKEKTCNILAAFSSLSSAATKNRTNSKEDHQGMVLSIQPVLLHKETGSLRQNPILFTK